MKKDFNSIISEMQSLERIQATSGLRQTHRSRYTVKGFMDMQKTTTFIRRDQQQRTPLKGKFQPSVAAISQKRSRVVQNISVDEAEQSSEIIVRKRGVSQHVDV
jgi:hypothetical protein